MVSWIIAAVILVVIVVLWRLVRGQWKESHAKVGGLPPAKVRRDWPLPSDVGERVMWCPILARKVILADTQVDDGELGTVVAFSGSARQPVIAFDTKPNDKQVVDKWGAARVLPDDFGRTRNRNPAPTRRTTPPKKKRN